MSISGNIESFKKKIPTNVELVAVSKTKPIEDIQEAYNSGHRIFGENKVQEMASKQEQLPQDIHWHMIGHLQTNKVKYIAPFVKLIHSVDRIKLLKEIDKRAAQLERIIDCLLQVHIAEEETKFGFDEDELLNLFDSEEFKNYKNIRIVGLMGMATNTDDKEKVANEFQNLKQIFDRLQKSHFANQPSFNILSMGMSQDYEMAIAEGSTMIRIGSAIFGNRNYN